MNKRAPLYALGALVLVAIVWRIVCPPAPVPPGPMGGIPTWYSSSKIGDMESSAVNTSGTLWAGVWNQKADNGKPRSAVWVIDLNKETAAACLLDDGNYTSSMAWADDNTVDVLAINTMKPEDASKSVIVSIDARTAKQKDSQKLKTPVARILAWGKDEMLAELAGNKAGQLAVVSPDGEVNGKTVALEGGKDAQFGPVAAVSGDVFVFSESSTATGNPTYYLGNAQTGEAKAMFNITDLSGRVEQILLSDKTKDSVGVLVYDSKKYDTLVYDCAAGKIKGSADAAAAKAWDAQPFSYATYQGGFTYSYGKDKPKKLFDFTKLGRTEQYWISIIQDGRLYKRGDGRYASVSQVGDLIDIRVLNQNGTFCRNLLRRR